MKKKVLVIVCFVLLIVLGYEVRDTYSLFESVGSGSVASDLAVWKIKVNDTDITKLVESSNSFDLGSFSWNSQNHVIEGKAAPGASGNFSILIDPTDTDVSFGYEVSLDFSEVGNLEFQLVSVKESNGGELIKTGDSSYAGVVLLSDIKKGKSVRIDIEFVWNNNEENNDSDYLLGQSAFSAFVPVTFRVYQYTGEE